MVQSVEIAKHDQSTYNTFFLVFAAMCLVQGTQISEVDE
jgi:hypothetical protein